MPARRTSDLVESGWSVERQRRYIELTILAEKAIRVACRDPVLYEKLKKFFEDIISGKHEFDNGVHGHRKFADEDDQHNFTGNEDVVGDHLKVKTTSAPKQSTENAPEENTPMTKNGRSLAYDERKKQQVCGACKSSGHNRRNTKCKLHPMYVF